MRRLLVSCFLCTFSFLWTVEQWIDRINRKATSSNKTSIDWKAVFFCNFDSIQTSAIFHSESLHNLWAFTLLCKKSAWLIDVIDYRPAYEKILKNKGKSNEINIWCKSFNSVYLALDFLLLVHNSSLRLLIRRGNIFFQFSMLKLTQQKKNLKSSFFFC